MSLDSIIRFRLPQADLDRINDIAERSGMSVSELIRQAAVDFVRRAEQAGKIVIPLNPHAAVKKDSESIPPAMVAENQGPYKTKK